jgi:hypothetical protein
VIEATMQCARPVFLMAFATLGNLAYTLIDAALVVVCSGTRAGPRTLLARRAFELVAERFLIEVLRALALFAE